MVKLESDALPPISDLVLADRYLAAGETTCNQVFERVASALAAIEPPARRGKVARQFYANMLRGTIGAGRIMANAGTGRNATMINCFVHPIGSPSTGVAAPSQADIERALEAARVTLAMGGGVGYDFSPIAPAESWVEDPSNRTRDVCRWIDRFDDACVALSRQGTRRGAQMAVLRCDHPDLPAFVEAKRGRRRWTTFNTSVAVTDAFMRAVEDDGLWLLRHRAMPAAACLAAGAHRLDDGTWCYAALPARQLWCRIVECACDSAEPGLLFIDEINRSNDLASIETICATNPCGEQPLPPWGSCVLGPIDLSRLVRHPFGVGGSPRFDFVKLGHCVRIQVRLLDNVLETTRWPLAEHEREARQKRRIGVGVTGLADMLAMMRLAYSDDGARHLAAAIARSMRDHAFAASAALARERGAYPAFNLDRCFAPGAFAARLPETVRDAIAAQGLRNSHLLSFAPTGSVSLAFAGNCSSGVEPAFDWVYRRTVRIGKNPPLVYRLENRAYRLFRELHGANAPLPAYFVRANEVAPADHIGMLSVLQPFVDAAISKTIIVSSRTAAGEIDALFFRAWRARLKGITVFRPDEALDTVLLAKADKQPEGGMRCFGC